MGPQDPGPRRHGRRAGRHRTLAGRLGEAAGLERPALWDTARVLPGVRLAVEGYVNFCRLRPVFDAVAASLTELSAPGLMRTRIAAFERCYPWIEAGAAYFRTRIGQGGRDSEEDGPGRGLGAHP